VAIKKQQAADEQQAEPELELTEEQVAKIIQGGPWLPGMGPNPDNQSEPLALRYPKKGRRRILRTPYADYEIKSVSLITLLRMGLVPNNFTSTAGKMAKGGTRAVAGDEGLSKEVADFYDWLVCYKVTYPHIKMTEEECVGEDDVWVGEISEFDKGEIVSAEVAEADQFARFRPVA